MESLLKNPVYNALKTGDSHLSLGNNSVKFFDEEVSPFVGFDETNNTGFEQLYQLLPQQRKILYAHPETTVIPANWKLRAEIKGVQFVHRNHRPGGKTNANIRQLTKDNVEEMTRLKRLTKPGPFASRTIEFGNYFGIFIENQLASMIGQRLHVDNYTEISAVCTHPDFVGRGQAAALMQYQVELIRSKGQIPFLHVRDDNERAIKLYHGFGFEVSRPMNFYFLQRLMLS